MTAAATATSTSPRLSSFSRRFRSPPPADSRVTTFDSVSAQPRNTDAIKSAKRYVLSTVRTDWEYDPLAPPTSPGIVAPSHLRDVAYRRREDWSSDAGSGPEDHRDPMAWTDGESDPYKYESPDTVAAALQQKKRKRRKLLKEEMQYNEGLRIFNERRDLWTCAASKKPRIGPQTSNKASNQTGHMRNGSLNMQFDFEFDRSRGTTPLSLSRASSPTSIDSHGHYGSMDEEQRPQSPSSTELDVDVDPMLPVAPPFLPRTNPIRAAITPSIYPTIYSKVVVQSLTPAVPIPLPDITRAMVQGWKDEGNWPPRSTITPMNTTEARALTAIRGGELASGLGKDGRGEKKEHHLGVRKGVSGAFRKALGLRGSGHGSQHRSSYEGLENGSSGALGLGADGRPMRLEEAEAIAMFEEDERLAG